MIPQKLTILVTVGLLLSSGLALGFGTLPYSTDQDTTQRFSSASSGQQTIAKVGVQHLRSVLAQETQTTTKTGQTETEPNNNPGEATVLEAETALSGTIPTTDDRDVFVFNASEGEQINIEMTREGGSGSLAVVLYTAELNFITGTSLGPGENTELESQANQTGEYYLFVGAAERGTGPYTLTRTSGADTTTEDTADTTPNKTTVSTPTTIATTTPPTVTTTQTPIETTPPNRTTTRTTTVDVEGGERPVFLRNATSVDGELLASEDGDYYGFTVNEGEQINVTLQITDSEQPLAIYLLDPDLQIIASQATSETTQLTVSASESGIYYLVVQPVEEGATGTYTITASTTTPNNGGDRVNIDQNEPNDDPDNATALELGQQIDGIIADRTDDDVFRLSVPESGPVNVSLTRTDGQGTFLVGLYSQADEPLTEVVAEPGQSVQLSTEVPEAGIYYLRIHGFAPSGSGSYTLTANATDESTDPGTTVRTTSELIVHQFAPR